MKNRLEARHSLRMPPELKARLLRSTVDSGRSMNSEILARLESSFEPNPAAVIADALRPIGALSDEDRIRVGEMLVDIGSILTKSRATE